MPLSGTIISVNESLEDSPELVNEDALTNFIIEIEIDNLDELSDLLSIDAYNETL